MLVRNRERGLDRQARALAPLGVCFEHSRCKVLLQGWTTLVSQLMLDGEEPIIVDRFTYSKGCLRRDDSTPLEMNTVMPKVLIACDKLKPLWRRFGVSLELKDRVYCASVRSVLFCNYETWSLFAEGFRLLEISHYRWPLSITKTEWMTSWAMLSLRIECWDAPTEATELSWLRWVGRVLHMANTRLSYLALFLQRSWRGHLKVNRWYNSTERENVQQIRYFVSSWLGSDRSVN